MKSKDYMEEFINPPDYLEAEQKRLLEKLEKEDILHSVPGGTDADDFFIQYARKMKALVVTNDRLRDWRLKDQWVVNNIDRFRVPFMILNGRVTFEHGALG